MSYFRISSFGIHGTRTIRELVHCKNEGVMVTPKWGVNCLCELDTPSQGCQYSDTLYWCHQSTPRCHSDTTPMITVTPLSIPLLKYHIKHEDYKKQN